MRRAHVRTACGIRQIVYYALIKRICDARVRRASAAVRAAALPPSSPLPAGRVLSVDATATPHRERRTRVGRAYRVGRIASTRIIACAFRGALVAAVMRMCSIFYGCEAAILTYVCPHTLATALTVQCKGKTQPHALCRWSLFYCAAKSMCPNYY